MRSRGLTTAIIARKMKNAEEEEFPEDRKKRERLKEPEGLPKGEECPHYPCHFKGQVCVFCYCPKYPCEDSQLGKWIVSSQGDVIWTCIDCRLIHKNKIAEYLRDHPKATIDQLKRIDAE
jgi:Zn-finger protein